ncbi:MAG TPA: hypothetical protein VJ579_02680 [Candidatus Paceibacterota bacterium]|nr:hypothetical protein [Candidatus Paceibacterota bacterium]
MRRNQSDFVDFLWHKQQHHLAFSIAAGEQSPLRYHDCMEMLDTILVHAEEEFELYPLVFVTGARTDSGEEFAGSFIVTKSRIPSTDEFDEGALLVLIGRSKETALTGSLLLFIHEETNIIFEH